MVFETSMYIFAFSFSFQYRHMGVEIMNIVIMWYPGKWKAPMRDTHQRKKVGPVNVGKSGEKFIQNTQ